MNRLLSLRRFYYGKKTTHAMAKDWLTTALPSADCAADTVPYLVVDLEMTGLNYRSDKVLSLGWVAIDGGMISLGSAQHLYIMRRQSVGQSAAIHQIRDVDLEQGVTESQAMEALLEATRGRVLVFHNADLDCQFINQALRRHLQIPLLNPIVDTMMLEKMAFDRANKAVTPGSLRLANCRQRYNLPNYPGHNAKVDALATAELLLAILSRKNSCTLGSLMA